MNCSGPGRNGPEERSGRMIRGMIYFPGAEYETIIYKIEKRRVVDGTPGPVVQTFYIPRVPDRNGFRYIDSQVLYGIQYQYDISPINLVIGDQYRYTNTLIHAGDSLPGTGHALGNALGFYRETQQDIQEAGWWFAYVGTGATLWTNDNEDTGISPEPDLLAGEDSSGLTGHFAFKLPTGDSSQVSELVSDRVLEGTIVEVADGNWCSRNARHCSEAEAF